MAHGYPTRYRMCHVGKIDFELMEPIADTGTIADFINRRGLQFVFSEN